MKAVVAKCGESGVIDPNVSLKTQQAVQNFLVRFEAAQSYYAECYERRHGRHPHTTVT